LLALLVATSAAGCVTLTAGGQASVERVWQATRVWVPATPAVSGGRVGELERTLEAIPRDPRLPSVIYLHGCRGFEDDLTVWAGALTGAGYAVFAPDARARGGPAPACDGPMLYTRDDIARFAQREAEVRYVVQQMWTLAWVAPEAVFLLGFDQGGVVAAGWRERQFAGIVVTGWTCTAPDMRGGLLTPADRPLLAIRWERDPFFRDPAWNGDCEVHLGSRPGSRSIVLEGEGHATAASPEAREAVLRFLRARTLR